MNYILFDDNFRDRLYPLTFTKPVGELRVGILKIKEKWEKYFKSDFSYLTVDYLSEKFKAIIKEDNILINGSLLPDNNFIELISALNINEGIVENDNLLAIRCSDKDIENNILSDFSSITLVTNNNICSRILHPENIFSLNGVEIAKDFDLITKGRTSLEISPMMQVISPENVFVEEGAKMECAIINASSGPVYIGKDAEVMEGSIVRGPFALCEGSALKLGAKIYGPTTIGPYSKVGGEVNNCVIQGYSNKGHDGFLGNSVIGEWCNIGADTNNSNLKNNYAEVRLWDYVDEKFRGTGLQFCGLIMGDHSKCGINTMFNTGTVVGVFANIFGSGFPRNFIASYAWGGAKGFKEYNRTAAFYVAKLVMDRRGIEFDDVEKRILESVFDMTSKYRKF